MKSKFTPGPWRWELNLKSKNLHLCGHGECGPYDYTVMDFERWGMGGAVPRFREGEFNTMVKAFELAEIVPERKHHSNWFQTLNHPDAKLIAKAPELYEMLEKFINNYYTGCSKDEFDKLRQEAESLIYSINE